MREPSISRTPLRTDFFLLASTFMNRYRLMTVAPGASALTSGVGFALANRHA